MKYLSEQEKVKQLREIKEVLDKYNVDHWLDCGTLLGAVRDRKFIPWDCDADLGVWKKDLKKILSACRELQKKGYTIELGRSGIGLEKNSSFPFAFLFYEISGDKAIKEWGDYRVAPFLRKFLDLYAWFFITEYYSHSNPFFFSGLKNKLRLLLANFGVIIPGFLRNWIRDVGASRTERYLSIVPAKHFMKLQNMKFYNMSFKVPNLKEEYLSYRYGPGWRTPRENWEGAKEDGTIFEKEKAENHD